MPNGGITGPAGIPRPLSSCELKVAVILEGRDRDIDIQDVDSEVESALGDDVSTGIRGPRFIGDSEITVVTDQPTLTNDQVDDIVSAVNRSLINQNSSLDVITWRMEGI